MRIGEIIGSSSTQFVSESLELRSPPALGSLVKVRVGDDRELFGVVCYGETVSLDPGRRAVRRSTEEVYDEGVYRENPQLEHVLRTEFTSLSVGVMEGRTVQQGLPAQPPPLHFAVNSCGPEETARFTEGLFYFRVLLAASSPVPPEQVLASHARQVYRARGDDELWLRRAATEVARLLREDYERLITALYAMEQAR
ncbi:MAG TPA: hypothetical protein VJ714_00045 [Anaerolineae bacterium]|nr:hypothetical protein [Anaerolineae bacterium]